MRPSHALARARYQKRKDFTTISVTFPRSYRHYTYKVLKSAKVKVGDRVVCQWPSGELVIGVVHNVHRVPLITGAEPFDFKWIVQKVDLTQHARLTKLDDDFKTFLEQRDLERLLKESVAFLSRRRK